MLYISGLLWFLEWPQLVGGAVQPAWPARLSQRRQGNTGHPLLRPPHPVRHPLQWPACDRRRVWRPGRSSWWGWWRNNGDHRRSLLPPSPPSAQPGSVCWRVGANNNFPHRRRDRVLLWRTQRWNVASWEQWRGSGTVLGSGSWWRGDSTADRWDGSGPNLLRSSAGRMVCCWATHWRRQRGRPLS